MVPHGAFGLGSARGVRRQSLRLAEAGRMNRAPASEPLFQCDHATKFRYDH
jgi:hypothetical protein